MGLMTNQAAPSEGPRPVPIAPSAEAWRAMSAEARESYLVTVLDALADRRLQRARASAAVVALRGALLAVLDARGLACPEELRAAVDGCDDLATLQGWLTRAATAASAREAIS
jgi:hypothetical protein